MSKSIGLKCGLGGAGRQARGLGFASLLALLAGISLPGRADYIDNFAVGPESLIIEAGEATAGGIPLSGLDTNQVLWGSRNFYLQADQHDYCGCRPIDTGDFSLTVSGSLPGSCTVQVAESTVTGSSYSPWIYLSYPFNGSALDWSAFDRIVITFTSPPTADMNVQAWLNSDTEWWYASSTAAAGSNSLTFLFSNLLANDGTSCTGINVKGCSFGFSPPMSDYFVMGDIQVLPTPCLVAAACVGGMTMTWPTNAVGFVLEHTTNLAQSFVPVTNVPVVVGTNYSVALPCSCPAEFFCLTLNP
jgi:hypothetical protein